MVKNKNIKLALLALSLSIIPTNPTYAISETTADVLSYATGTAGGIACLTLEAKPEAKAAGSIAAMLGLTWLGRKFFGQFTAKGRLKRAEKRINKANADVLLKKLTNNDSDPCRVIRFYYPKSNWHLVKGKMHIEDVLSELNRAIGLLSASEKGNKSDTDHKLKCVRLKEEAVVLSRAIVELIEVITNNRWYSDQYKVYQKHEELKIQRQMLYAERQKVELLEEMERRERLNSGDVDITIYNYR